MVDNQDVNLAPEGLDAFLATPTPAAVAPQTAASPAPGGVPEGLDEFIGDELKQEKYGGLKNQAITALEGAGSAATFGLSTGLQTAFGVDPEAITARREVNPGSHMLGQGAGLVATALIPGVGEANAARVMEAAGVAGAKALGLGAASAESLAALKAAETAYKAGTVGAEALKAAQIAAEAIPAVSKIGSAAVKATIENAIFQSGDEVSKLFAQDPQQNIESAIANVGLAGLTGGVVGGALGTVAPLWDATLGKKTGGMLKAITDRLGGIEGDVSTPLDALASKAGIELAPEVRAALGSDPHLQQMALSLSQTDTTKSGLAFQNSLKSFNDAASDSIAKSLGKTPKELATLPELSKYEAGKKLGRTLSDEYHTQVSPVAAEFDELANKYNKVELVGSIEQKAEHLEKAQSKAAAQVGKLTKEAQKALNSGSPEKAIQATAKLEEAQQSLRNITAALKAPGTTDTLSEQVMSLAAREGWTASPSSDIMKEVNRVLKEVKGLKDLRDLKNYATAIGDNMQSDPMNGPLRRAGGMIKNLFREAEADVIAKELGHREGVEAVNRYADVRRAYAEQSALKEAIDSRLHAKGSTSGYAKAVKEMADTDGETLLRRLSGSGDADLLAVVQQSFPKTAQALKQHHIENLLHIGISKAKPGEAFNAGAVRQALDKMSPELRKFAITPEAAAKIDAVGQLMDKLKDSRYNFSNTARTVDSLTSHIPGGVTGLVTALVSGNAGMGLAAGVATKYLAKDIPDAMRLGLLKFLGSNKPMDPGAFKAAVDTIRATIKGENAVKKATKDLFKASQKAVTSTVVSQRERDKLDKLVVESQADPKVLMGVGGKTAHYMPEHGQAMAQTAMTAIQYLNSQRPNTAKAAPLDSKLPPDPGKLAKYKRALDIAAKPLIVLDKVKNGSVTPDEIVALKSMYPGLYNNILGKLTEDMTNHIAKGDNVPYKTRIGLSLFSGTPLDSTLTGPSILAAQPKPIQPDMPAGPQVKPPPASSTKGISKLPTNYQTADQARARRSQKN